MLNSTVEIRVHCGSPGQGHICLADNGPRYLSFSHDTSFITGCSWILYITTLMHLQMSFSHSGVWPDWLRPAATSPQGHRVIPPHLYFPLGSIHQSHPHVTPPLCLWDQMMQKIKNCRHFFFFNHCRLLTPEAWIWSDTMRGGARHGRSHHYRCILIYYDKVQKWIFMQFTERCEVDFEHYVGSNSNLLRK